MFSLPASIKRIGSKTTEERWRHHFPHYKSMGAFCCHGNQFWSNQPQNLKQPFPHPSDAIHKIWSRLANWLQRYSSSKVWNFRHSRASNSKWSGLIRLKIELDGAFMPFLVFTSNVDDDSIKNERASKETPFSYYKSMGIFFRRSRAANSIVSCPSWPKFKLVRDFMHVLVICKYKKDRIKSNREKVETPFSPVGAFCCQGHQSFNPICPKTLGSLSPTTVMLHIKFDQDWSTGSRDIQVWMCGRRWRTDDRPLVYYKLTLWAFGSVELKTR